MSVLHLLVTGEPDGLFKFHLAVAINLNAHRQRNKTVSYSCMAEDLPFALEAAKVADVTVQQIITTGTQNPQQLDLPGGATATVSDCIEEYPVLYLASSGEKWEAES